MSDTGPHSYLVKGYDAKLLKRLTEDIKFLSWLQMDAKPLTPEQKHRSEVESKWYNRRVNRVKRVMEAYRVPGSWVCECDY